MNKLILLVLALALIALAITFNWAGSRSIADSTLEYVSELNHQLQNTGDELSDLSDKAQNLKKDAE